MKGRFIIEGINYNVKTGEARSEKLVVHVTKDKIGCTVSIGSEKDGRQYTIPFDWFLLRLITEDET